MAKGLCGKNAGLRLDPAPLHRQPVRILIQARQQVEVLSEPAIVIAGWVRGVAVLDPPRLLFPIPPIVCVVAAFDLVGGRGRPPEKVGRKSVKAHPVSTGRPSTSSSTPPTITRLISAPTGPSTAVVARSMESP